MSWQKFPTLDDDTMRLIRQSIDQAFRQFTRDHGEFLEAVFAPLKWLLIQTEWAFIGTPWWLMIAAIAWLCWLASHSWKTVVISVLAFLLIGYLGMWQDTMKTLSMIVVASLVLLIIGIPIGILLSQSNRLQSFVNPLLDVMQTLPIFVYLIPVVMLLGIGRVPGLLAVVIYAIPPMIRLTNLGIRLVSADLLEAADAFGATKWQKLIKVQLPLALPTIMAGINQSIMLALGMVVISAMIGVEGLGQPVLRAINNQYFTMGLLNGFAIVVIAIVFDRISQQYGARLHHLRNR
jgi:glycine betaine/proline transport system permease protein